MRTSGMKATAYGIQQNIVSTQRANASPGHHAGPEVLLACEKPKCLHMPLETLGKGRELL